MEPELERSGDDRNDPPGDAAERELAVRVGVCDAVEALLEPAAVDALDGMQVDLVSVCVAEGDPHRPPVDRRLVIRLDEEIASRLAGVGDHIEVGVVSRLDAEERIDAPAAADPASDAGPGEEVEDDDGLLSRHDSAGITSLANSSMLELSWPLSAKKMMA